MSKKLLLGVWVATQAACSPAVTVTEPVSAPTEVTTSSHGATESNEAAWGSGMGSVVAQRFDLRVPLPSGAKWEIMDPGFGWFVARQARTHSELRVRVWREDRLVRIRDCERRLRSELPLFAELDSADILSRDNVELAGFRSELVVAVARDESEQPRRGFVVAYGAKLRSCFAAVFSTRAEQRAVVENRLLQIEDRVIRRITQHAVEDRVGREQSRY